MKPPDFAATRRIQDEAWTLIRAGKWTMAEYERLEPKYVAALNGHPLGEAFAMLKQFTKTNPFAP